MRFATWIGVLVIGAIAAQHHGGSVRAGQNPTKTELRTTDAALTKLAWLSGSWLSKSDKGSAEEHWTHGDAGTMFGVSRTIAGGKTVFFEFLRIENTPDGITYFGAPKGRNPATPFKATSVETNKAVFENPKHDFPQKITYWKTDDGKLHAKVEGPAGTEKSSEWTWDPAVVVGG